MFIFLFLFFLNSSVFIISSLGQFYILGLEMILKKKKKSWIIMTLDLLLLLNPFLLIIEIDETCSLSRRCHAALALRVRQECLIQQFSRRR